jgi:2-keto-4-pentenoate hydratase
MGSQSAQAEVYSPPQIAVRYKVKADKVVGWIKAGLLRGIDVSSPSATRPRFVVYADDLKVFEDSRVPKAFHKQASRRRSSPDKAVEEFV